MRKWMATSLATAALMGCADELPPEQPSILASWQAPKPLPTTQPTFRADTPASDASPKLESPPRYLRNVTPGPVHTLRAQAFDHVDFHVSLGAAEFRVLDEIGAPILDWTSTDAFMGEIHEPVANEGFVPLPRPGFVLEFRGLDPIEFARFELGSGHVQTTHDPVAEIPDDALNLFVSHPGRWIPTDDVLAIANTQYLPYSGAPSSCSGTFLAGTREVADFLKASFEGATSYGGYACRANTANTSQLSVHASGRAIDLFVPLHAGDADNDLGDPIAHYLIMNAENLGIEFIVWDRTSWGASRSAPKHRAYTGPHPHHDHLHIELSPTSARLTGRTFPPLNLDKSPAGYLDAAGCDTIAGWAQDPDAADRAIPVHIYIGGPAGSPGAVGYTVEAKNKRDDLCAAIGSCNHGFSFPTPRGFLDGQPRDVYVYGIDVTGGENALLGAAPKTLQCDRPNPPFAPEIGVKRHVPNPEAMAAWGFDFNDVVITDDNALAAFPESAPMPAAPMLARVEGQPEVYLVEPGVKRHVPNPTVMDNWKFSWDTIAPAATLDEHYTGVPVTDRPFLARGTDGRVFVIEPAPPLWADQLDWNAPPQLGKGQTAQFTLSLRNRGSVSWSAGALQLRPTTDIACAGCDSPLNTNIAPGESTSLDVALVAANTAGPQQICFELVHAGFAFDGPGQGGPADTCLTLQVVENPVDLPETSRPNPNLGTPRVNNIQSATTDRGCSSTPGWPGFLTLALAALFRRRPRRG